MELEKERLVTELRLDTGNTSLELCKQEILSRLYTAEKKKILHILRDSICLWNRAGNTKPYATNCHFSKTGSGYCDSLLIDIFLDL